ncbi:alpha/beta fold hydrolase [Microlunatus parietis]|uniref:Pimeloyl-ACP methyl ester carboxylesterase n=1 Tax=Microlunatus parietis TaxID=682979 RepID=A0A7Y9I2G0_9ACTN|nr:alpha/beta hydrolase [Microlunatus parietis]NYE69020.1 pimeloyl-ACP methyl ester carboxylesterase [Microlunatus parietis]
MTDPSMIISELSRLTTPYAIEETRIVELGDSPQVVSLRGRDRRNPVLIMVHGGPGTSLSATSWMWQRPLEESLTIIQYDQRGAGRSFRHDDPDRLRDALSLDHCAWDTIELAELITAEFGIEQVLLAGHSWGTAVATRAALLRPDLFAAYLGVCQIASTAAGEAESWRWARAEADRRGDRAAAAELDAIAPYPESFSRETLIIERRWVSRFGGMAAGRADSLYFDDGESVAPDWSAADQESARAGREFLAQHLLPRFIEIDFTMITEFPIPIMVFLGRHDYVTPTAPALAWLDRLAAPAKIIEWFDDSAHLPMYEEPGHFLTAVLEHLLPYGR